MARLAAGSVGRQIESLFDGGSVAALTLLLLGAIATGAVRLNQSTAKSQPAGPPFGQPPLAVRPDEPIRRPAPGRMFVTGRVLDPQGKPVANAAVMVYARSKEPGRGESLEQLSPFPLGQANGNSSVRFQLEALRTSSSRNDLCGAVANAPGYGAGWVELDPDAEQPTADITLRAEQVILGRLFDVDGQPARGVKITVANLVHRAANGKFERLRFSRNHGADSLAWPQPATSDGDGRFTVRGVGVNLMAMLTVDDPRFARMLIPITTDDTARPKQVTRALEPAKIIAGRITYADTGKPVPHAPIDIAAFEGQTVYPNEFETDAEGRFRANPMSADRYSVSVLPPAGQPYLNVEKSFQWPKGALEYSIEVALPRGVVIHGKVTEAGSSKPLAGARLTYLSRPLMNNRAGTGTDGSFAVAVAPGPGYLVVQAPSDDYVLQEFGSEVVQPGQPQALRYYGNAVVACDVQPAIASLEVNVELHRGVTVEGQVVGPDGKLVQNASMISRVILPPPLEIGVRVWRPRVWRPNYQGAVRDGHFELHGLGLDPAVPVFFLEPRSKLGATINLSGKSAAGGPITVHLEPCGMAKARLVEPGGKPVEGYPESSLIAMVVTFGPAGLKPMTASEARLAARQGALGRIDPTNHGNGPLSDIQGRIAFSALIPGATYCVIDRTTSREDGPRVRRRFTVKPGEKLDLGDILIEKPQVGK